MRCADMEGSGRGVFKVLSTEELLSGYVISWSRLEPANSERQTGVPTVT
jgi:hypothetical protein